MTMSPRDELWKAAYSTLYESGYNEIFAEKISVKWQQFDDATKFLVALTATSSSAAAGLAIWSLPVFKQIWIGLASVGVVLSIASAAVRAPDRLKSWLSAKQECGALYTELETFMFQMKINKDFPVEEFTKKLDGYRSRYGAAKQRIPSDWFATDKLALRSQEDLNSRLTRSTLNP